MCLPIRADPPVLRVSSQYRGRASGGPASRWRSALPSSHFCTVAQQKRGSAASFSVATDTAKRPCAGNWVRLCLRPVFVRVELHRKIPDRKILHQILACRADRLAERVAPFPGGHCGARILGATERLIERRSPLRTKLPHMDSGMRPLGRSGTFSALTCVRQIAP